MTYSKKVLKYLKRTALSQLWFMDSNWCFKKIYLQKSLVFQGSQNIAFLPTVLKASEPTVICPGEKRLCDQN